MSNIEGVVELVEPIDYFSMHVVFQMIPKDRQTDKEDMIYIDNN